MIASPGDTGTIFLLWQGIMLSIIGQRRKRMMRNIVTVHPLRLRLFFYFLGCCGLLGGCVFQNLKKELNEYDFHFGIEGKIEMPSSSEVPVLVALYRQDDHKGVTVDQYLVPDKGGRYAFIVSEGSYFVAAFADANNNFAYDQGEACGFFGKPTVIMVDSAKMLTAGRKVHHLSLINLNRVCDFPEIFPHSVITGTLAASSYKKIGEVKPLDDHIFQEKNGSLGYWKPMTFLRRIGIGIYFLHQYDPKKIPVLFVHGAVGTPAGWKPIVDSLDHNRFQPWFFYYPSAFRLDVVAGSLNNLVKELHDEKHFRKLYIIAHSMGGLVSRAFIIKNSDDGRGDYIEKFISISTPWGGVNTAEKGVKYAPTAIPSWNDVTPGSDFLKKLYRHPLPDALKFYLLFGVRGKCSMVMANNDGTVEIASEIDYRAQENADGFYGFDEDHMSILTSKQVLTRISNLLSPGAAR